MSKDFESALSDFENEVSGSETASSSDLGKFSTGNPEYDRYVLDAAKENGVDPALVGAVIGKESRGNPRARSPKNAQGLMQLIPATARRFGVTDPFDARQNIHGGVKYLKWLLDRYKGDVPTALAGYNAGEGRADKYGANVPIPETQDYVRTIMGRYGKAQHPPSPASDATPAGDFDSGLASFETDAAARTPQKAEGQIDAGNIDLHHRPVVKNPDGSISTVRSMSVNIDGKEVLLPTVSDDGRLLTKDEAIEQYKQTGKHLGTFDSIEHANAYAQRLHEDQAKEYGAGEEQPQQDIQAEATEAARTFDEKRYNADPTYRQHIDTLNRQAGVARDAKGNPITGASIDEGVDKFNAGLAKTNPDVAQEISQATITPENLAASEAVPTRDLRDRMIASRPDLAPVLVDLESSLPRDKSGHVDERAYHAGVERIWQQANIIVPIDVTAKGPTAVADYFRDTLFPEGPERVNQFTRLGLGKAPEILDPQTGAAMSQSQLTAALADPNNYTKDEQGRPTGFIIRTDPRYRERVEKFVSDPNGAEIESAFKHAETGEQAETAARELAQHRGFAAFNAALHRQAKAEFKEKVDAGDVSVDDHDRWVDERTTYLKTHESGGQALVSAAQILLSPATDPYSEEFKPELLGHSDRMSADERIRNFAVVATAAAEEFSTAATFGIGDFSTHPEATLGFHMLNPDEQKQYMAMYEATMVTPRLVGMLYGGGKILKALPEITAESKAIQAIAAASGFSPRALAVAARVAQGAGVFTGFDTIAELEHLDPEHVARSIGQAMAKAPERFLLNVAMLAPGEVIGNAVRTALPTGFTNLSGADLATALRGDPEAMALAKSALIERAVPVIAATIATGSQAFARAAIDPEHAEGYLGIQDVLTNAGFNIHGGMHNPERALSLEDVADKELEANPIFGYTGGSLDAGENSAAHLKMLTTDPERYTADAHDTAEAYHELARAKTYWNDISDDHKKDLLESVADRLQITDPQERAKFMVHAATSTGDQIEQVATNWEANEKAGENALANPEFLDAHAKRLEENAKQKVDAATEKVTAAEKSIGDAQHVAATAQEASDNLDRLLAARGHESPFGVSLPQNTNEARGIINKNIMEARAGVETAMEQHAHASAERDDIAKRAEGDAEKAQAFRERANEIRTAKEAERKAAEAETAKKADEAKKQKVTNEKVASERAADVQKADEKTVAAITDEAEEAAPPPREGAKRVAVRVDGAEHSVDMSEGLAKEYETAQAEQSAKVRDYKRWAAENRIDPRVTNGTVIRLGHEWAAKKREFLARAREEQEAHERANTPKQEPAKPEVPKSSEPPAETKESKSVASRNVPEVSRSHETRAKDIYDRTKRAIEVDAGGRLSISRSADLKAASRVAANMIGYVQKHFTGSAEDFEKVIFGDGGVEGFIRGKAGENVPIGEYKGGIITLSKVANGSVLVHEVFHHLRDFLPDADQKLLQEWATEYGKANPEMVARATGRAFSDVLGGEGGRSGWTTGQEEIAAAALEGVLATGEMPEGASPGVQAIFTKMKNLFARLYTEINRSHLIPASEMHPEVRGLLQKMALGEGDPEIIPPDADEIAGKILPEPPSPVGAATRRYAAAIGGRYDFGTIAVARTQFLHEFAREHPDIEPTAILQAAARHLAGIMPGHFWEGEAKALFKEGGLQNSQARELLIRVGREAADANARVAELEAAAREQGLLYPRTDPNTLYSPAAEVAYAEHAKTLLDTDTDVDRNITSLARKFAEKDFTEQQRAILDFAEMRREQSPQISRRTLADEIQLQFGVGRMTTQRVLQAAGAMPEKTGRRGTYGRRALYRTREGRSVLCRSTDELVHAWALDTGRIGNVKAWVANEMEVPVEGKASGYGQTDFFELSVENGKPVVTVREIGPDPPKEGETGARVEYFRTRDERLAAFKKYFRTRDARTRIRDAFFQGYGDVSTVEKLLPGVDFKVRVANQTTSETMKTVDQPGLMHISNNSEFIPHPQLGESGEIAYKRGMERIFHAGRSAGVPLYHPMTEEFKKWFGESKVVDKRGEPLTVYHGSPDIRNMSEFTTAKERYMREGVGETDFHDPDRAFFFSDNRTVANTYADDHRAFDYQNAEPGTLAVHLKIENPLVVDWGGKPWRGTREVIEQAKRDGHDGVIIKNVVDPYTTLDEKKPKHHPPATNYVVFDSNQIKSVENQRPTDDSRILYHPTTATPEFKAWFGDSKAVDDHGNPKIFYHGTNQNFDVFDTSKRGAYFTDDADLAGVFSKYTSALPDISTGANIMPVYLKITTPAKEGDVEAAIREGHHSYKDIIKILKSRGFDGIMKKDETIVFEPKQVKSIFNRGSFDASTDNILKYPKQGDETDEDEKKPHAPTFYSQLERAGEKIFSQANAVNAKSLANQLAKYGVTKAELEDTGTTEFLNEYGDKRVDHADWQRHINLNRVKMQEDVLGTNSKELREWKTESDRLAIQANKLSATRDETIDDEEAATTLAVKALRKEGLSHIQTAYDAILNDIEGGESVPDEWKKLPAVRDALSAGRSRHEVGSELGKVHAEIAAHNKRRPEFQGDPHYAGYTVPGGEDYTERLFRLPTGPAAEKELLDRFRAAAFAEGATSAQFGAWANDPDNKAKQKTLREAAPNAFDAYKAEYDKYHRMATMGTGYEGYTPYDAPHFQGHNHQLIMHTREQDREIDGGRYLEAVEVQSDLHQEGGKFGYQDGNTWRIALLRDGWAVWNPRNELEADELDTREEAEESARAKEPDAKIVESNAKLPPKLPLSENWHEVAVKRMIHNAAERGYKGIILDDAKTHIDRWGTQRATWKPITKESVESERLARKELADAEPSSHRLSDADRHYNKIVDLQNESDLKGYSGFLLNWEAHVPGTALTEEQAEQVAAAHNLKLTHDAVVVRSRDDIETVIKSGGESANDARDIAQKLWKRMQKAPTGTYMPRAEGLQYHYDEKLPSVLRKIAKRYGTTVEKLDIPNSGQRVTRYEGPDPDFDAFQVLTKDIVESTSDEDRPTQYAVKKVQDMLDRGEPFHALAIHMQFTPAFDKVLSLVGGKLVTAEANIAHGYKLDIPDSMREKLLTEGQPLYSPAAPAREDDEPLYAPSRAQITRQLAAARGHQLATHGAVGAAYASARRHTILDALDSYLKANILSAPKTLTSIVASNAIESILRQSSRVPAAFFDTLAMHLFGTHMRTVAGNPMSSFKAMEQLFHDIPGQKNPDGSTQDFNKAAWRRAMESYAGGISDAWQAGSHGNLSLPTGLGWTRPGWQVMESYAAGIFGTHAANTAVWNTVAMRASLDDQARAIAKTEELNSNLPPGLTRAERYRDLIFDPTDSMVLTAIGEANQATFQQSTKFHEGLVAAKNKLADFGNDTPAGRLAGNVVKFVFNEFIPFSKLPSAIVANTVDLSGGAFVRAGFRAMELRQKIAEGALNTAIGQQQLRDIQRRMAMSAGYGTIGGILWTGFLLGLKKKITGTIHPDQEPARARASNIAGTGYGGGRITIGNLTWDLHQMGPAGQALLAGKDVGEAWAEGGSITKRVVDSMLAASNTVLDLPAIKSFFDLESLRGDEYKQTRYASGYTNRIIPAQGMLKTIAEYNDGLERNSKTLGDMFKESIPGKRKTIEPKLDPTTGEPLPLRRVSELAPFSPQKARAEVDPVIRAIVETNVAPPPVRKRRDETDDENAARRKETLSDWRDIVREATESDEWSALPPPPKQKYGQEREPGDPPRDRREFLQDYVRENLKSGDY